MLINVSNQQFDLEIPAEQVQKIVRFVLNEEGQTCDEVNIYFVDTPAISQLHEEYFNDPSPTDCISFPIDQGVNSPYTVLGEVFVCPATAIEYSAKHRKLPYDETTLYIVHGLLHLLGYDDISDNDRKLMHKTQAHYMKKLRKLGLQLC